MFVISSVRTVWAEEAAGQAITFSSEEQDYISRHDTVAVALSTDLSPMEFYDEDTGRFEGFTVKYFELLSKKTGLKFEYVPRLDIDTLKKQGEDQEIQMVGIIAVNGAADLIHAEETDSPYSNTLSLIYKTSHENDVKKDRIGIMAGYPYFKQTAKDLGYQNIQEYASARDCALAVKQGKADAAMVSTVAVYMILNHAYFDNLTSMELAETKMSYCFGVFQNEDSQTLLNIINKGIRALPEEDVKNARMSALMSYQAAPTFIDRVYENKVILLFSGFLIILAILVMFTRTKSREQAREVQRLLTYVCHANKYVLEYDLKNQIRTEYFFQDHKLCHRSSPLQLETELKGMILPEDYEKFEDVLKEQQLKNLVKEEKELVFEARLMHQNEEGYNWYIITLSGMKQDRKHPCSFMCFIRDIQKLKDQEEESRRTLTDALQQAENASRAKGDFMSRMSHEIRTPLNAIIGYLEIAKDEKEDREKIDYCMEKSQVASRHLLSIINDVLDISSIESGRMKIAHDDFDLKQMVNALTVLFFSQAKEKGITFEVHLDFLEREWLCGDELRVRQVLLNLLSNAVKFTPSGGSIFLNISQLESSGQDSDKIRLKFEVKDTGIGMSKEYKERMFTPFEQESASTARNYGGTGLGLSISHNLIRMMGGDIQVESEQGKGTAFTVILAFDPPKSRPEDHLATESFKELKALVVDDEPDTCSYMKKLFDRIGMQCDTVTSGKKALRRVTSRLDSAHPYDLCIIDWYMKEMDGVETAREVRKLCGNEIPIIIATAYDYSAIMEEAKEAGVNKIISKPLFQSSIMNLLVTNFGKYRPEKQKEAVNIDFTGTRLLLAEDNEMNMEIALDILRKAGFIVTPVTDGQEAFHTFTSSAPDTFDAILMDIQMPVMDGYTATRKIRESEHPEAKTIPIIAMTANAFTEDVTAALAAGMNDHVAKPISYDRLFHVLSRLTKPVGK